MQEYQAERLARTETAYVQEKGIYDRYTTFGGEKSKMVIGV